MYVLCIQNKNYYCNPPNNFVAMVRVNDWINYKIKQRNIKYYYCYFQVDFYNIYIMYLRAKLHINVITIVKYIRGSDQALNIILQWRIKESDE